MTTPTTIHRFCNTFRYPCSAYLVCAGCRCIVRRRLTVAGCTRNNRAASAWDLRPAWTMSTISACY
jgi:hypothetical protein